MPGSSFSSTGAAGVALILAYAARSAAPLAAGSPGTGFTMTVLVNPDVTVLDEELIEDWEGCLSIPELRGRVPRYRKLRVDALDRHGNKMQFVAEDFFARVIQHEWDHLMGKVYLDRMRDLQTLSHLQEFQRYWLPAETNDAKGGGS